MTPRFPKAAPPPSLSAELRQCGIALRRAMPGDLPFLRDLYAGFRAAELAFAPWSAAQKRAFTDDQFRLQHLHFTRHFARANFWVIEQATPAMQPRAIGRLYLDRSIRPWRIIDIGLLAETRGQGLGTAMIAWLQEEASKAGAGGIALSVAASNAHAAKLYGRMGFVADGENGPAHRAMRWQPEDETQWAGAGA